MNISLFISKKIVPKNSNHISRSIVQLSVISVALCISILIVSFAIAEGFAQEIKDKVIGFGAHVKIVHLDNNTSFENQPIPMKDLMQISTVNNVKAVQFFATKAGIVKGEEDIEGVMFKGIDMNYKSDFFQKHLLRGRFLNFPDSATSDEIIISQLIAHKLKLDTGNKLLAYFVQNPVRQRMFTVVGIYNTGFGTLDKSLVICDLKHIQKLNDWQPNEVGGAEVLLYDFSQTKLTTSLIDDAIPYNCKAHSIIERHKDIFDWIDLFNQNVNVLIILIVIIAAVALISTQLTFILEHISTIGILKTLGCTSPTIGNIFVFISLKVLSLGLFLGNLIGLGLYFVQSQWQIITLNPENYYVSFVPMEVRLWHILMINAGAILISVLILILPAYQVSKTVKTVDALKME